MVVSIRQDEAIAFVEIDNPPVNATSQAVRQGLMDAVETTEEDPSTRAIVLVCAGKTFIAGADVREFDAPPLAPHLPDVVKRIESASKPWIAAIHGHALGGGLEIAMGCSHRIAESSAQLGLPEVTLGLIPGAGGTVRLPRLIGATQALEMITTGKPIDAAKALKLGLLDKVTIKDLRGAARQLAQQAADNAPVTAGSMRSVPPFDEEALAKQIAKIKAKARGQKSPIAACDAVTRALTMPLEEALTAELATFLALKNDPQSAALRHIFFAERATGRIEAIKNTPNPPLAQVGVVGGGTMGAGIAAACLLAGLRIIMIERTDEALNAGMARVQDILQSSLKRGLITTTEQSEIQAAFSGDTDYSALANVDLAIEAVFEEMSVKHVVFKALDAATRPDAILASNTSYLDVGEIANTVRNPVRVIGLHFFSPAHIMKLLELVIPPKASAQAIATGAALGKRLGKITVSSGVCDGFIGNRIMSAYRRACDIMLEDGALPDQIDSAMRSFGFPIGIFEMQDLAGLDISWAMRKRKAATRDSNERYVDIADKLCEAGRFGRKTGRGWYHYEGLTTVHDPKVEALILAESARKGIKRRDWTEIEIMDQILSIMQAEGTAILSEGIAAKLSDIDVVMINGYGFPRWRGGPMYMQSAVKPRN